MGASLATIATAVMLLALAVRQLSDVDFWWQNATGRWILRHGISPGDVFTFSRAGTLRTESSWLYCVVLHLLNAALGIPAIVLLKSAALTGIFLLAGPLSCRRSAGVLGALALALAVYASHMRFVVRPELVTMASLVAFLVVLASPRLALWRRAVILVVVQAIWVNSHSLFLLGPAIVALWAAEALLQGPPSPGPAPPRLAEAARRAGVLSLVLGACLLNPYRTKALAVPLHQLATLVQTSHAGPAIAAGGVAVLLALGAIALPRLAGSGRRARGWLLAAGLLAGGCVTALLLWTSSGAAGLLHEVTSRVSTPDGKYVVELRSALDPLVKGSHTVAAAALTAMATLCIAAVPRRVRPHQAILLACLIGLTLLAVRNVAMLSLCAAFIVWRCATPLDFGRAPILRACRACAYAVIAASCLGVAWAAQTNRLYAAERWAIGSGTGVAPSEDYSAVAGFLDSIALHDRFFNTHGIGSFLIDRGFRVFVDSRAAAGILDELAPVVTDPSLDAIDGVSARYGVRAFVVETRFLGLVGRLAAHPRWRLCYADPNAVVFLAPDVAPGIDRLHMDEQWLARVRQQLPRPLSPDGIGPFGRVVSPARYCRVAWLCLMAGAYGHAREMLEDALRVDPARFEFYDALAYASAASARFERAAEVYEIAISRDPRRVRLRMDAARAYLGLDDLDAAERHARIALELPDGGAEARFVLGTVLLRQCRDREAVSMLESAVLKAPEVSLYHANLATAYLAIDEPERAAEEMLRATEIDPGDAAAWRDACRILARLHRYEEASRCLVEAERLDPRHPDLEALSGQVVFHR